MCTVSSIVLLLTIYEESTYPYPDYPATQAAPEGYHQISNKVAGLVSKLYFELKIIQKNYFMELKVNKAIIKIPWKSLSHFLPKWDPRYDDN